MPVNTDSPSRRQTFQRVLRAFDLPASPPTRAGSMVHLGAQNLYRLFNHHGVSAQWITSTGSLPMLVAGNGPVLLLTYLDDAGLPAHRVSPADFHTAVPSRRQRAVAAAAAHLIDPTSVPGSVTLVIETDRNSGSLTLETWLRQSATRYRSALWEAPDLPVRSPTVVHSACGVLAARLSIASNTARTEALFSGVATDLAGTVIRALAGLAPADHMVMLDDFYDGVSAPDTESLQAVYNMTPDIAYWPSLSDSSTGTLPASHMAMGLFFAPSVGIRSIQMSDRHPLLPDEIEVVIEFKLVPGQSTSSILDKLAAYFAERIGRASVSITTLLAREPVTGRSNLALLRAGYSAVLPVTPGYTPAGLLESHDIPTIGYLAACNQQDMAAATKPYDDIDRGSALIRSLIDRMHRSAQHPRS